MVSLHAFIRVLRPFHISVLLLCGPLFLITLSWCPHIGHTHWLECTSEYGNCLWCCNDQMKIGYSKAQVPFPASQVSRQLDTGPSLSQVLAVLISLSFISPFLLFSPTTWPLGLWFFQVIPPVHYKFYKDTYCRPTGKIWQKRRHVKIDAEIGIMWPQGKEAKDFPRNWTRQGCVLP